MGALGKVRRGAVGWIERIMGHPRLAFTVMAILAVIGVLAAAVMPRQEDPPMKPRHGQIVIPFPGAEAESVERLVVRPVEKNLKEVEGIGYMDAISRTGVAVFSLELEGEVRDIDEVWNRVREKVGQSEVDFPEGVLAPVVETDLVDQDSIVLAVTGSGDRLELMRAAEVVEEALLGLHDVKRVRLYGDPGSQIVVEYGESTARRLGLDPLSLSAQLSARNALVPGGTIVESGRSVILRPNSEFGGVDEIRDTPVVLPSGTSVPLEELADVRYGATEPTTELMRYQRDQAVVLGVVPRDGQNLARFGREVRSLVDRVGPGIAPLRVAEVTFQPDRVEDRLADLGFSLMLGVLIVAGVLILAMGPRMGLIVASVVPLVTATSLGIYFMSGGILHQISVAAFVIAIGMLVDNAIVIAESVQQHLDRGESRSRAALMAVRELALPLFTATGTTVAAFMPMLLSQGEVAEFTVAIPVIVILTLSMSYLFAVFITPPVASRLLPAGGRGGERGSGWAGRISDIVARTVRRHPVLILAGTGVAVVVTLLAARFVDQEFFPEADRNQMVVDIALPEGTHIDETDRVALRVESFLAEHPGVRSQLATVGRGAPRFYYNVIPVPNAHNRAQIVVNTTSVDALEDVERDLRAFASSSLPEADVFPRPLEQGPPVDAPVQVKIYGTDLDEMLGAAETVADRLADVEGAIDVRHDMGVGMPSLRVEIDDTQAARSGLSRREVSLALLGRTHGLPAGQYRGEQDPVPIVIRSPEGEYTTMEELGSLGVSAPSTKPVTLSHLARTDVEWRPASIFRENGRRMVTVTAHLGDGATFDRVLASLREGMKDAELPASVEIAYSGAEQESREANMALFKAMPIGIIMLLFFLMVEFESFRRVGIILLAVPLAATGVVPGLVLGGQPFGFMSMLGVFALVGVVVNNAIVLLEVIETKRREGLAVIDAVEEAIHMRTRPIILTTVTTVAGLLPLALSDTSLWPPLAWAIISGLLASTAFTLLVVPTVYRLLIRDPKPRPEPDGAPDPRPERRLADATAPEPTA